MQQLRVNTAALQTMATSWGSSAAELAAVTTLAGFSYTAQSSAIAVNAAHADVAAFTSELADRVGRHADHVVEADRRHGAGEFISAGDVAALSVSPTRM